MEIYLIPIQDETPGEKLVIYRPVLGLAFIGNRAMADLAVRLASSPTESVFENVSFLDNEQSAAAFLDTIGFMQPDPVVSADSLYHPTTAVLLMTNRCQLRCLYCYAAAGEFPERELSIRSGQVVMDAVCDYALQGNYSQFEVYFHGGGEPTYAWNILKQATAYARSKPLKARLSLTSNGMWSPDQLDWIVSNLDGVGVSMDGFPTTQDRQRPVKSGKPSSPIVLRNISELDRRAFPYGLRLTSIPPFDSLPDDMTFICERMNCSVIQVEPAYNFNRGGLAQPDENQAMQFAQAFIEAFEIARSHGRRLYYSGARPDLFNIHFCNSPYTAMIVTPEDDIVACYEVVGRQHPLASLSTLGHVQNNQIELDIEAREKLYATLAQRRDSCRGCFCYWSCAGDCYTRALLAGVDRYAWHSQRCEANRTITKNIILSHIEEGGGVWKAQRRQVRQIVQAMAIPE